MEHEVKHIQPIKFTVLIHMKCRNQSEHENSQVYSKTRQETSVVHCGSPLKEKREKSRGAQSLKKKYRFETLRLSRDAQSQKA